ncbi:MAG: hypothetical protein P1P63_04890 [Treponemataceae bacterium]
MQARAHSKTLFARFYVLLAQMPGVDKEDLVWQYSGLLTTSLREFHERKPYEYVRMINDMQRTIDEMNANKPRATPSKRAAQPESTAELKRLRSAILHRLQKHGIDTTDWNRVNAFMRQPRIAGKTLGEMSIDELKAFIPKMQSILSKDKEIRDEYERMARMN